MCDNVSLQSMCRDQETGLQEAVLSYYVSHRKQARVHRLGSGSLYSMSHPACLPTTVSNSYAKSRKREVLVSVLPL